MMALVGRRRVRALAWAGSRWVEMFSITARYAVGGPRSSQKLHDVQLASLATRSPGLAPRYTDRNTQRITVDSHDPFSELQEGVEPSAIYRQQHASGRRPPTYQISSRAHRSHQLQVCRRRASLFRDQ